MIVNFPVGSIMWAKTPNTENYMPSRMRVFHRLWKFENGQKTELIQARWSANGGVHGDNNHPAGSGLDLPLGSYCWELFNLSENQVPIQQIIIRGDSTNTNTLWGLAPDLTGNACHRTVQSGERKEIHFKIENFTGSQYYHFDCNAWFVGADLNFTSTAIPSFGVDWGLNPLRITLQEGYLYFYNTVLQNPNVSYLSNGVYFPQTTIINPLYISGSGSGDSTDPKGGGGGAGYTYEVSTITPRNGTTLSKSKMALFVLGGLLLIKSIKNGNSD